jgi:hypothetical protein
MDRLATKIIPHGCSADDLADLLRHIQEQGMPTINRATRRKAERVRDAARRRKASSYPRKKLDTRGVKLP